MSNCETFSIPIVEASPHQVREVLRCLLHTILFNRALGMVVPRDVESELLDITYVTVNDPEVEAVLEGRLATVCAAIERTARSNLPPPSTTTTQPNSAASSTQLPAPAAGTTQTTSTSTSGTAAAGAGSGPQGSTGDSQTQVVLSFFERRQRAAPGWWGSKEERLVWESWIVNIRVVAPNGPPASNSSSSSSTAQQQSAHTVHSTQQTQTQAGQTTGQQGSTSGAHHTGATGICGVVGLEEALATITRCVSDRRDHIPPVVSSAAVPFSWDVAIAAPAHGPGRPSFSLNSVKRMLLHTSPPPLS